MSASDASRPSAAPDTCRLEGTATLHVLGSLDAEASAALRAHLAEGCVACAVELRDARATVARIDEADARAAGGAPLPPGLREQLLTRIGAAGVEVDGGTERDPGADPVGGADGDAGRDAASRPWTRWAERPGSQLAAGLRNVPADGDAWQDTDVDGVSVRPLAVDGVRRMVTMLVRMAPGSSYPAHRHAAAEQCLVLEGDLCVADRRLSAGDFQEADAGSTHGIQSTESGCTLLIVSSQDDELLPV